MRKIFWTICMLGTYMTNAQINDSILSKDTIQKTKFSLDYAKAKPYKLKDVIVTGDIKYSKNQIIRYSGLSLGEDIEIPGTKVNNAIKKLWRSNIFSDIDLYVTKIQGDEITLELALVTVPNLGDIKINGVKKSQKEDIIKQNKLNPGVKITQSLINNTSNRIKDFYTNKGFPDAKINVVREKVAGKDEENVIFNVNKGERVKISDIVFEGNKNMSSSRLLRNGMKNTKKTSINIFRTSKMVPEKFQEDLKKIVEEYKSIGFRDAKIDSYNIEKLNDKRLRVKIKIDEGKPYYLGNVTFSGNSIYTSDQLQRFFAYKKGDAYDAVGINKKISGSERDDDITTQYLDRGYLFARVVPIEKRVKNDTIDLEIKIFEGVPATLNRVSINGNTTAHDHILYRELRTKPGDLFSKSDIKRTMMELASLGYLEPKEIAPDIQPNQSNNTVDIDWKVAPKSSSQVELQGGYGGGTFIGTLGLTFGNFSIKNFFNKKAWKPVPMGDGQQLSVRAQVGTGFKSYSLSFVEPWVGGRKPTSLSTSIYYSKYSYVDSRQENASLRILGGSVGLSKLLTWPDDYFRLSSTITYQLYNFHNYNISVGDLQYDNGSSNNLSYTIGLTRNSAGPDPIFPQMGSDISISFTTTFPYSSVNKKDYTKLSDVEKFKWLEFYKIKAKAYFYQELVGKLVIKAGGEFGVLGTYNRKIGTIPFERFYVGGTGLNQNRFDGREIIQLRGYRELSNSGGQNGDLTPKGGGTIYNKYSLELRYPIVMSQSAKIYGLTFAEGANVWNNTSEFKPFDLKRSAGLGIRLFMPAFGLLGFDFGYGFDKAIGETKISGWHTHFIIGQQF